MRGIIAAIALTLAALGAAPARAANQHVDIVDFSYKPQTVTVFIDETVDWKNLDTTTHTATSDAPLFDSGSMQQNDTFAFTFRAAGTYPYHCTIHPDMKGTVIVTGPVVTSPSSIDFGTAVVGSPSAAHTVTVTNEGTQSYTLGTAYFTGTNPSEFPIQTDSCSGVTLTPGASCDISLAFLPAAEGQRTATLDVPSDAPGSPSTVSLKGFGTTTPTSGLELSTTSMEFGFVKAGATSDPIVETITSNGIIPLHVGPVSTTSGLYDIATDTCSGVAIPPGQTCTIGVTFRPVGGGLEQATLRIESDAPSSPDLVSLSGTGDGVPPVSFMDALNPAVLSDVTAPELYGHSVDDQSGIASVKVTYTVPVLNSTQTVTATLVCMARLSCAWKAPAPSPGFYVAQVSATDRVGNTETSGPTAVVVSL